MVIALINQPWDREKCTDPDTQNKLYGCFISISFMYKLIKIYGYNNMVYVYYITDFVHTMRSFF